MKKGKVILMGAGPGDPELLTVKAARWLAQAEVILIDRLVSAEIVEQFAHPEALVLPVGKQCSRGIRTPQASINSLLVEYAEKGKLVVRLKGGDSSIFSNILDELETLEENQIPYEIVPGVTSFSGAAAYTGIPLTARNHSRGIRILTAYKTEEIAEVTWKDWATTDDTLVFYMSGQKIREIASELIRHGVDPEKGLAVIEQATTAFQKTRTFSFEDLDLDGLPEFAFVPTLLIVGKTVGLHPRFAWFGEENAFQSYFDKSPTLFEYADGR
jgi:uroporphyrin-III C-methyltransferase